MNFGKPIRILHIVLKVIMGGFMPRSSQLKNSSLNNIYKWKTLTNKNAPGDNL